MKLVKLIKGLTAQNVIGDIEGVDIKSLSCDTRNVKAGALYFCLSGKQIDGHSFAREVHEAGAAAIVCERILEVDLPQIIVKDSREAMAYLAAAFYGNAHKKLKFITVTGTNGKTSTTYFLRTVLLEAGLKVGLIGTIGVYINDEFLPATLTTPDPIEFHAILKQMYEAGVEVVVMEASAHAITLKKLFGVCADVAILTNVTQDHIDFYGTFENYENAKLSYFAPEYAKACVVNADTPHGRKLINEAKIPVYTFGLENPAGVFAVNCHFTTEGTSYFLNLFDDLFEIKSKVMGKFNLYNALGAAAACKVFGVAPEVIAQGLKKLEFVDGRFNVITLSGGRAVVIDYAHTPDSLQNILTAARGITKGRLISVFGCGGNRDSLKRPVMGRISGELADFTIITSDNPRFERPEEIISQIEQGIKKVSCEYICVTDRKEAVFRGISELKEDDVMVLSGKGAEGYLEISGIKHPYSDAQEVRAATLKLSKEEKMC